MTDVIKRPYKLCQKCGRRYTKKPKQSSWGFERSKFCSVPCAQAGQRRVGTSHKPRTHCKSRKHEWIPENIWTDSRGQGKCKLCSKERDKGRKRQPRVRVRKPKPRVVRTPKPKPALQSVPTPVTPQRPVWRPAGFAPVPNTRRAS